jgi:Ca-activated chloride channel homolog
MSDELGISVIAEFDRELVWERGRSVRYLEVDVAAPFVKESDIKEKPPLNIALVIDASGSMAGAPLECAKKAAAGVVNAMSPSSRISLVSFSTDVVTHFEGVSADANQQKRALHAINELAPRNHTNLGAGWMKGAECLAKIMEDHPNMHNHVILLSDGHANFGVIDPDILGHHAEQLRTRGIATSTVGIGDQYSSEQLQALADNGGGMLHDAQFPHEIIEVVLGELHTVQDTLFEGISVSLKFPSSVKVENISAFPTVMTSSSALAHLGMLAPQRNRNAIFRLTMPEGRAGDVMHFDMNCSWIRTGNPERVQGKQRTKSLTFVNENRNLQQPRKEDLSIRVAKCWQAGIVRKCVALNKRSDLKELARYLDHELKYFTRYCHELHGTEHLVSELQGMRERANRRWDERSLKHMDHSSYMTQQSHQDYRSLQRGSWLDSLGS